MMFLKIKQLRSFFIFSTVVTLTACATTTSKDPNKQAKLIEKQQNAEQKSYQNIHTSKVGQIDLVLRHRKITEGTLIATEQQLMLVERGKSIGGRALSGLLTVVAVTSAASGGGYVPVATNGFTGKENIKGKPIQPEFKNNTLDYAQPIFTQWLQKNATQLAPSQKPLQKVAVESNRFALIYEKVIGKATYQLYNEFHITFYNDADYRQSLTHTCAIHSKALPLTEWQANQYQAVNRAIQSNLQQCIESLEQQKANIAKRLTPKA